MRRRLLPGLIAVAVAALGAAAARFVGLDGPHAVVVGFALLAAGVLLVVRPRDAEPAPPSSGDPRDGGRRDLDELAWSMLERRTEVRRIVLDRVRTAARPRLAAHGLDPDRPEDGPAVARLLGPVAWSVLRPDRDRAVLPSALDATLQALETIDPARRTAGIPDPDRTRRAD